MRTVTVEFEIDVPDEATLDEVERFVKFECGAVSSMGPSPISENDLRSLNPRNFWVSG